MRRMFTHENFGDSARVELCDNEVAIVFVARTPEQARDLAYDIMENLKDGDLRLTLSGQPITMWDLDEEHGRAN